MKRIDLSTVWLLVEVIIPTVFLLYVFSTASLRSESIVLTNLHWALKKTITTFFGLGDAFANFDQLTSLPRLFIVSDEGAT